MTALSQESQTQTSSLSAKLLRSEAYVNGVWCGAASGDVFPIHNPANGVLIGQVPNMTADDNERAIDAADKAFPQWRAKTAKERSAILRRWHDLIISHAEDLAGILTAEQGKPLAEAQGEVKGGAAFVEWFAEEAKRAYGDTIPTHKADARVVITKEPIGVVGAITPWNFPNAMITRKVAPALAAGCTVVLKPAEDTPLSALALAVLAEEAGIPGGVFNVVTANRENTPHVGEALAQSSIVRKVSFTGSTEVGKKIAAQSVQTLKKVSLELGGNAPFIVFETADLDKAVEGALASKYRNAGQTCICANRIYVQDSIYDAFADKFAAKVREMNVGSGMEDGTDIGPLINSKALDKVIAHVDDAVKNGAELMTGGNPHELGGLFYQPTVLKNMTDRMRIKREETFGPVAALFKFSTEEEIIEQANDTNYGLAAYFYTRDLGQSFRVSEALEYGMVGVNEPLLAAESVPFGGVKESGIGREGSKYGLDEFCELKYTLFGGL